MYALRGWARAQVSGGYRDGGVRTGRGGELLGGRGETWLECVGWLEDGRRRGGRVIKIVMSGRIGKRLVVVCLSCDEELLALRKVV